MVCLFMTIIVTKLEIFGNNFTSHFFYLKEYFNLTYLTIFQYWLVKISTIKSHY